LDQRALLEAPKTVGDEQGSSLIGLDVPGVAGIRPLDGGEDLLEDLGLTTRTERGAIGRSRELFLAAGESQSCQ
jgi:hypothetical protein